MRGRLSHRRSRRLPAGCERPDQTITADATPSTADLGYRRSGKPAPEEHRTRRTHARGHARVFIYICMYDTPRPGHDGPGGADAATRPPGRPTTRAKPRTVLRLRNDRDHEAGNRRPAPQPDDKKKQHAMAPHSGPTNSVKDTCRTPGISKAAPYRHLAEQRRRRSLGDRRPHRSRGSVGLDHRRRSAVQQTGRLTISFYSGAIRSPNPPP